MLSKVELLTELAAQFSRWVHQLGFGKYHWKNKEHVYVSLVDKHLEHIVWVALTLKVFYHTMEKQMESTVGIKYTLISISVGQHNH